MESVDVRSLFRTLPETLVVTFPNAAKAARTIPKMFYRFYDPFLSSMLRDRKVKTVACCNAQLC